MTQATTLNQLARIRADNRGLLNTVTGSQGTALGRKNYTAAGEPTGAPCVIVYVPHKIHEALLAEHLRVPPILKTADGALEAPTDVVVTTTPSSELPAKPLSETNKALVRKLQWLDGQLDYLAPGSQLGGGDVQSGKVFGYSGTLGFAVQSRTDGTRGILTNQHVGLRPGHTMYVPSFQQQSLDVGITRRVAEYVPDDRWISGVDEEDAFIRIDGAFVAVRKQYAALLRNEVPGGADGIKSVVMGKPALAETGSMDIIDTPVKKVGRTTGLQHGVIVAYGYGIWSEEEALQRSIGREPPNYYTDFLIAPRGGDSLTFSDHGDSGSAILIDRPGHAEDNRPIALLWGGWPGDIDRGRGIEDLTYGISLPRLLDHLDLELIDN